MLSIGGTSDDALKAHASNWGVYEESAKAHGKTPDRKKWRIVTFAHVAETREQAHADMEFGLEDFRRYFAEVATFPIVPPDITSDPAEYLVASGIACIGTPDDCIRHFERLWRGSNGGFGGVLLLAHDAKAKYASAGDQSRIAAVRWRRDESADGRSAPSARSFFWSPASRPSRCRRRSTNMRRARAEARGGPYRLPM
jgi:alkanesulfonate monooxygenase SsuD/methylene tetrahydromethanopterin reductase-like flavin-dependent oxidoreductase (luciferase family)